jgi:hypothetical protein
MGAYEMLKFYFDSIGNSILDITLMKKFWENCCFTFCQMCFGSGNVELIEYLRQFLFSPTFPLPASSPLLVPLSTLPNESLKIEERQRFFREAAKSIAISGNLAAFLHYQQEFNFSLDKDMCCNIIKSGKMDCILHFKDAIESFLMLSERISLSLRGSSVDIVKYFLAQQPVKTPINHYLKRNGSPLKRDILIYLQDNYYL